MALLQTLQMQSQSHANQILLQYGTQMVTRLLTATGLELYLNARLQKITVRDHGACGVACGNTGHQEL